MVYVRLLIWDAWNVAHIARHEVTPEEVEEVCHSDHLALAGHSGRVLVCGQTRAGRLITVALDPEPDRSAVYYPVTARPASRKERRYYQERKGGEPA